MTTVAQRHEWRFRADVQDTRRRELEDKGKRTGLTDTERAELRLLRQVRAIDRLRHKAET